MTRRVPVGGDRRDIDRRQVVEANGADIEMLGREGSWVRVRVEGWAWAPEADVAAAATCSAVLVEDLQAGIRQRLLQERAAEVEQAFRNSLLEAVEVEVDQAALAAIEPLSPPAPTAPPQPPALPSEG